MPGNMRFEPWVDEYGETQYNVTLDAEAEEAFTKQAEAEGVSIEDVIWRTVWRMAEEKTTKEGE
jgi:LDH2 family malate/lactate/ureidoglycolate dehydrogenase